MSEAKEFRKLTTEEFQLLSEDEKEDYIRRNNEKFRNVMNDINYHTEEMKKIISQMKKITQTI
jgi:hypothetical protein